MNIKFDELMSEIDNLFYKEEELNITMSAGLRLKELIILLFTQRHVTAMVIGFKHISPLCQSTL